MNPLLVLPLLALPAAPIAAPIAAPPAARSAAPAVVRVHTQDVRVAPGAGPQEFTLECQARESLLSGGFSHESLELRVMASSPSSTKAAWMVGVLNPTRAPVAMKLSVVCVSGGAAGGVASTVRVATGSDVALSARCPNGTIVTGGGYSSSNISIVSSYPAAGEGWAVTGERVPGTESTPPNLAVYAVCLGGASVRPAGAGQAVMQLPAGRPRCSPAPGTTLPICSFPRTGTEAVSCEGDIAGGGYEMTSEKTPPLFAIRSALLEKDSWRVTVTGYSILDLPLSVRLIAICVMFVEPVTDSPVSVEPVAERDEILPIIATTCLLSALVLAFVLVMTARLRSRARRGQQATVSVVLTSHHSSFRLDQLREIP